MPVNVVTVNYRGHIVRVIARSSFEVRERVAWIDGVPYPFTSLSTVMVFT